MQRQHWHSFGQAVPALRAQPMLGRLGAALLCKHALCMLAQGGPLSQGEGGIPVGDRRVVHLSRLAVDDGEGELDVEGHGATKGGGHRSWAWAA